MGRHNCLLFLVPSIFLLTFLFNGILGTSQQSPNYGHPLFALQIVGPQQTQQMRRNVLVHHSGEEAASEMPGMSSLTFVFDRTGSMNDDLNQVRQGAKGIFETVMKQRKKLIYNFVLVLFHDPDVDPPFISTDPDVFQQQLASVSVQGGGDCPEMTLSGIKKALEVSLPGSYIYVFTDARSKDYHLEDTVLNLIQEKQSSVVFVMTGDCGNRSAPGYKVFERIAAASFGQVFHLEKSHVNTVLEYVRHAVAQRKVHILYEVREHGQTHTSLVPVDAFFSELTISLAGERDDGDLLSIALVDPQNRTIDRSSYEHEGGTIDLTNVKLVRIKNPLPGVWRVRTSSRLKHTLRIFGHSTIDFKYGFASRPVATIDLTHPRPIAGQSTFLLVNMTGLNPPGTVVQISLVDYHGRELYRNETRPHSNNPFVYFVGPFIPPKGFFFIRVNGEDEQNYEFVRIAPTAISTVEVIGPRAYMAEKHTANAYSSVNLSCSIESRAPFTVYWMFGGRNIGGPLFYQSTDTSTWTIDAVTSAHRGYYTCQVISQQGNHSAVTFLDSKEPPPDIVTTRNESVILRGTAFLHCKTQSIEQSRIQWIHKDRNVGNSAKAYTYENGTLRILDATFDDAGAYICRARTSGGQTEATIWLSVWQAPRARIEPRELFAAEGATFNLSCHTEGRPKPEVIWYFRGARIMPDQKFFVTYKDDLIVSEMEAEDAGRYECRANNPAGTISDYATVHLAVPPSIHVSQNKQMIVRGDRIVLDCRVTAGMPMPKIVWFKDGRQLVSDQFMQISDGKLTVRNADESDAGTYACKAENEAGSEIKPITLGIGSAPTIVPSPENVYVQIERTATLLCRAAGIPKPKITWLKKERPLGEMEIGGGRYLQLPDDSLLIKDVHLVDEGRFSCVARNEFGEQRRHTMLHVTGLVSPVLASIPPKMEMIEGKDLQINCIILLGNPRPNATFWLKDGQPLIESEKAAILPDGSLLLRNGSEWHRGKYSCTAESQAGTAKIESEVQLIMRPKMAGRKGGDTEAEEELKEELVANDGGQLSIPCPVEVPKGQAEPKIIWTRNSTLINLNTPEFNLLPDKTLHIPNVRPEHSGIYICTAINAAGEVEKVTVVQVHTPPSIVLAQSTFNLVQGDTITLPCEAQGMPKPTIRWFLNEKEIVEGDEGWMDADGGLVLDSVDERHRGVFKCVAENVLGRDERLISISVHTAPVIEGAGITRTLVANESDWLELKCPAIAHPPPQRQWSWEGIEIDGGNKNSDHNDEFGNSVEHSAGTWTTSNPAQFVHMELPSNGSLIIRKVAPAHAGSYECHVSNMAGDDRIQYSLKVQTAPRIVSESTQNVIQIAVGNSLDLFCRATGTPNPTISWEKEHLPLVPNNFSFIDPQGTLHFRQIRLVDSGEYTCRAKNPAGEAIRNVKIVAQVPPRMLDSQPSSFTFIEHDVVDIYCSVDGDPKPEIEWLWQGRPIAETQRIRKIENGVLRIVGILAEEDGYYTCRATNAAGQEDIVIKVSVISAPEMRDPDRDEHFALSTGEILILQCPVIVNGPPNSEIRWFFNDAELATKKEGITFSDDKRRLKLEGAKESHSGVFKCMAENLAGDAEKLFHVDVMTAPFRDESVWPRELRLTEGQQVEIGCPVGGTPAPSIVWLLNTHQVLEKGAEEANGKGVKLQNGRLLIGSIEQAHNGTYVCVASNPAGTLDIEVKVTVLAPPKLGQSEHLEAKQGGHVTLNCDLLNAPDSSTSITWLFNHSTNLPPNAKLLSGAISPGGGGSRLHIPEVQFTKNRGIYACLVRNSVGQSEKQFQLDILVPPNFGELFAFSNETDGPSQQQQIEAKRVQLIVGQKGELWCPISGGNPPPTVEWLLNGIPLELKEGETIRHDESGINHLFSPTRNLSRLQVTGSADGEFKYACIVTNKAGTAKLDFVVQIMSPPRLIGPSKKDDKNETEEIAEKMEAYEGNSVTFECPLSADTLADSVKIQWFQKGKPIEEGTIRHTLSEDRTRLTVINVRREDAAPFTCKVSNFAGETSVQFQLNILIPPQIDGPGLEQMEYVEGQSMDLQCNAEGSPSPTISWTKDKSPLVDIYEHLELLKENHFLFVKNLGNGDAGAYTCLAQNEAGKAEKTFQIRVIMQPRIKDAENLTELEVPIGQPITFECPLLENPGATDVKIEWTQEEIPLSVVEDNIQLLDGGKRMTLMNAMDEDSGKFACLAENLAGQAKKEFKLVVLIPPKLKGSQESRYQLIQNQSLILNCEIDEGVPLPQIEWTKDGRPLNAEMFTKGKFKLMSNGQQLKMADAGAEHAGEYACLASNKIGHASLQFHVQVIIPPALEGNGQNDRQIEAFEGDSLTFLCPLKGGSGGVMAATIFGNTKISWTKNSIPFDLVGSEGGRFGGIQGNLKLIISRVNRSDEGIFACLVRNEAGQIRANFHLNVLTVPRILVLEKEKNKTIVEGNKLLLNCPAEGKPEPEIRWRKGGELLLAENITTKLPNARLAANGVELRVDGAKREEAGGRYSCEASNRAGTAEQDFYVDIQIPPKILRQNLSTEISGPLDHPLSIACPVSGHPPPQINWLKSNRPIEQFNDPNVYMSSSRQKLHFSQLKREHLDIYICLAKNAAGEDQQEFRLNLLEAPKINENNLVQSVSVIAGQIAILECPVSASPEPTIVWLKDGHQIGTNNGKQHKMLDGGKQLKITDANGQRDAGSYTCLATNSVGSAELNVLLRVIDSPTIPHPLEEMVRTVVNKPTFLHCEVDGTEPIFVEWQFQGQIVAGTELDSQLEVQPSDPLVQVSDKGRRLNLMSVQKSHNGSWNCGARNSAGDARKTFQMIVQVPPTIDESSTSAAIQSLVSGDELHLDCIVDAFPQAKISWTKDGNALNFGRELSLMATNGNQSLWSAEVGTKHEGRYTCLAENAVGTVQRTFMVKIASPPMLEGPSEENVELLTGQSTVLQCRLEEGSTAKLRWKVNGKNVEGTELGPSLLMEYGKIMVKDARLSDAGEYECVAENEAGQARKMFQLNVLEPPRFKDTTNTHYSLIDGQTVILDCGATGTPQPSVIWLKDGKTLTKNEGEYEFVNNAQMLHIEEVDQRHVGRYSCVAENVPGRAEKDILVTILRTPIMLENELSVEVAENETQTLECPVAEPIDQSTQFEWTKGGVPMSSAKSHIQFSASGRKMHLMKAHHSDAGKYICKASNAAGEAEAYFDVIILVPPRIDDPHGYRTLEALVNESVQLQCNAGGIPAPNIEWLHDGHRVVENDGMEFANNNSFLRIASVQLEANSGRYTCVAINKLGRAEMDIFLDVIEPPNIWAPATELNVVEGSEQRLECIVSGHPLPKVEWRKGGELLALDGVHPAHAPPHSHFLHIRSAQQKQAGRYTCIGMNKGGEQRQTIQLNVLVPPTISDGERMFRIAEGGQLALECPAEGWPKPTILWRKMPEEETLQTEIDETGREMMVKRGLEVEDGGRYNCEATNEAGKATADFIVEILVAPTVVPSPATFQLSILEGANARMECRATGNPEPTVRWLRAGRPLSEHSNLILSPRGDALMVLKTRRTDAGEYTCQVENSVGQTEGTFTLNVLVAPHINETLDQNPRAMKDKQIRLACPVLGLPKPEVKWLKNGQELLKINGRMQKVGNDLVITNVRTADAGRYMCRAENEAGQLDTEFELEVIAPPQFIAEGETNFEVVQGESIIMECPVEATPSPEISWFHGIEQIDFTKASNFRVSSDNKRLNLLNADLNDGGKYICQAKNEAGHSQIDLNLRVLVPPRIDKSNVVNNPLAIIDKEIFLECPVSGIPQPTIIWQREGQTIGEEGKFVLKQENQTLGIRGIRPEDQGKYSCIVQNKAGELREEFQLEVLVPPQMEETAETAAGEAVPLSKREGDSMQLICPLKATTTLANNVEELKVAWSKDGRPLEPEINENIEITEHPQRRLQLRNISLSDSGEYKCVASNRAGQSFAKFSVEILSKPKIDTSRNSPEPHVISGRPITLWCPASGNPLPTVNWFLNAVDISKTGYGGGRYRLLDQGQGLEIQPSTTEDIGLWTCQAENTAGQSTSDISLDVWVEPTVRVLVEDTKTMRPVGDSISLLCEVEGNPEPVLSWSLHDQTIIPVAGRIHISKGGQRLEIPRLRNEDAGEYYCVAQNEVGSASDFVAIEILVPPSISRDTVELNPRLPMGRSLTLFCDVSAKPSPKIRWFLNGTEIDGKFAGGHPNLVFGESNRFIQIQNTSLAHRGAYRCEASNPAGNDSIEYRVDVFEPPSIVMKGGTEQVVEGRVAVLECNASGEPAPVITWQRNGVLVETGVRYALEETKLKVIDARSSDSGIYVCVATNEAGTDQQAFTLEVLIPPKATATGATQMAVPQKGNVTLKCAARGYPQPQIHWSVEKMGGGMEDFVPLSQALQKGWDYKVEENGNTLQLYNIEHERTRQFRCSVVNNAGIDEIDFAISVVRPPALTREGFMILNVSEGQPIRIPCGVGLAGKNDGLAMGEELKWTHNGKQLGKMDGGIGQEQQIEKDGTLRWESAGLAQAGNYTCIVKNSAGYANATVLVNVGVPPKISEEGERAKGRVIVEKGGTAELWCEAVGIPPPRISWFRDEMPLNKFVPTAVTATENSVVSGGQLEQRKRTTAIFSDVQSEHAGVYTCLAENWAGKGNKTVDLVVLIPPSVQPEKDQLEVESGQMAVIHCNATGSPEPIVSWVKATEPPMDIVGNEQKYQLLGTSLAIRAVDKDDHGFYHCIARSEAGQAIGVRRVVVKLPLSEMRRIYVECDDNGTPIKSTYVRDRGDRPQQPNEFIHWAEETDVQSLPENVTDGVLIICLPNNGRAPRRAPLNMAPKIVEVPAGKKLKIGEELIMECRAIGHPIPSIHWQKDGEQLESKGDLLELEGGDKSILQLRATNLNQTGEYHCVAKNELGEAKAMAKVEIDCPDGYNLDQFGQKCLDVNECETVLNICPSGQLCFNQLGTFSCIPQPCPAQFRLDATKRQCLPMCRNCSELPIHLHTLSIPKGLPNNTRLLRLTAHDKNGRLLRNTQFQIKAQSSSLNPEATFISNQADFHFGIQPEANGRATIHSTRKLADGSEYRLAIRSSSGNWTERSNSPAVGRWQSNYLVLITVSKEH